MNLNVTPSEKRPFRDRPGEHTCVGLNDINVDVLNGPVPIQSFHHNDQWQTLEGVDELMGQAVAGPARAVLCRYGPRKGILIYGGSLGLSLAGAGLPVIWTEKPEQLPDTVQTALGVEAFTTTLGE